MRDLALTTAGLPFGIDDSDAANCAFAAGRAGDERAQGHADQWAYAYMVRYMLRKYARERTGDASDIDAAEERAMAGFQKAADYVDDAGLFASYVSRICRNAFISQRRKRTITVEADDDTLGPSVDDERHAPDGAVVRQDVSRVISALPPAVRAVAEMVMLGDCSYEETAEALGHPLPTVRTYVSKARAVLRESALLRSHHYADVMPPDVIVRDG